MGFIDFFKKIIGKDKVEEVQEQEKLTFDEIGNWIENKTKEIENREKEIFGLIKDKISEVITDLDEKLKILENIDFTQKKSEDRIKFIVKENVNSYAHYVKILLGKLSNLEKQNLEKFIADITEIFSDFDKKSYTSYQKATFLIGKEMAAVRVTIVGLSKYLENVFKENKDLVEFSKKTSFIKLKLKQMEELKKTIKDFDEKIKSLDRKIIESKEINENLLNKIKEIKETESYIENLKKQEEIKLAEKELEKEIYNLKDMINFKALGNIFHVNKKQMALIKDYKEDFQTFFRKDNGESILKFLNEAKLNNNKITTKIEQIDNKKEEIIKNKEMTNKDETLDLLNKTRRIGLEIENLNNEKAKDLRIYERLKITLEETIEPVKKEMSRLNIEII